VIGATHAWKADWVIEIDQNVTASFHVQDMNSISVLVPPQSRLIQGYRFMDLINVLYLVSPAQLSFL
jgi:hypothetical protein